MIINYWLVVSTDLAAELEATLGSLFNPAVSATTYPLLNSPDPIIKRSWSHTPSLGAVKFTDTPGTAILSAYVDVEHLGQLTAGREWLQSVEAAYYPNFWVAGMWNWDGSPVGGAGSPWFPKTPELEALMGGVVKDVNLNAGQMPRQFV